MSISYKDYYATLGVAREASPDEIKRAFRSLARKYHPDRAAPADQAASEAAFKEISEAYEVLKDPEKRAKYDALGQGWRKDLDPSNSAWQTARSGRRSPSADSEYAFHFGGTGFSDFFEQYFGGNGEAAHFKDQRTHRSSVRGSDLEAEILVTFEEVLRGGKRRISFSAADPSTGREERREFDLRIPAGVTQGQRLRVAGHGENGFGSGGYGDLYLTVKYEQHPDFEAKGCDLYSEIELAPWEAVLGARVPVPTLDGVARVSVPPGTSSGRQLRLRGKGLPTGCGNGRGDHYVTTAIAMPESLSDRERELWNELARCSRFEPRPR